MEAPVVDGTTLKAIGMSLTSLSGILPAVPEVGIVEAVFSFNALTDDALEPLQQYAATLETLVLDNNELEHLDKLPVLPQLRTLWLNNNSLENLDGVLGALKRSCPSLRYLSLLRNPCCPSELNGKLASEYRRYRLYTKFSLPTLTILDADAFTAEESKEAAERGKFCRTAIAPAAVAGTSPSSLAGDRRRPTVPEATKSGEEGQVAIVQTAEKAVEGDEQDDLFKKHERPTAADAAFFTQQRHFYTGRTSEGNRFICDHEL